MTAREWLVLASIISMAIMIGLLAAAIVSAGTPRRTSLRRLTRAVLLSRSAVGAAALALVADLAADVIELRHNSVLPIVLNVGSMLAASFTALTIRKRRDWKGDEVLRHAEATVRSYTPFPDLTFREVEDR